MPSVAYLRGDYAFFSFFWRAHNSAMESGSVGTGTLCVEFSPDSRRSRGNKETLADNVSSKKTQFLGRLLTASSSSVLTVESEPIGSKFKTFSSSSPSRSFSLLACLRRFRSFLLGHHLYRRYEQCLLQYHDLLTIISFIPRASWLHEFLISYCYACFVDLSWNRFCNLLIDGDLDYWW